MRPTVALSLLLAAACGSSRPAVVPVEPPPTAAPAPAPAPAPPTPIADRYREVANAILDRALADEAAHFARLRELVDGIGARLSGSPALDRAIAWAVAALAADGHEARTEPVMVPRWVRGAESATLVAPRRQPLAMLGLGGSVGTPPAGLTAPVLAVSSWDELEARAAEAAGRIVLFDVPMPAWSEEHGTGYGETVSYRWGAASAAARHGAVAALVRSVTARSLGTPHTGSMGYADGVPKIPAAALAPEDASLLHRLADAGERVEVELKMAAQQLPDAPSANVIGELRGAELPDEVVVIGAHLDSWDVGTGAHDDGGGCVAVMRALTTLRALGLAPRRTIRVVLFTNEENGLRGGRGYAERHAAALGQHVMALEMDMGAFAPLGVYVDDGVGDDAPRTAAQQARFDAMRARMADVVSLLAPLGATRAEPGHGGADISPLARAGVPALGLMMDSRTYFDYHHSAADTLDKVDPAMLAADVAAVAVVAYVVADLDVRIDAPLPAP